jgi:DNA invertase Pin-like site-specific DNA recombinase
MARTSRNMTITQNKVNVKKYRAALYVRLSNDDENKDIESNSVTNQRALLTNFVDNSKDIQIHDYYIDDGFSGVNFNRPDVSTYDK